jgi:putative ABC transport system permease protein
MGTILKIALRNLTQHKVKSLIVGALITLGITLTFIGNSLFESASEGVKRGYSQNFTGDIMIQGKSDKKFSLFGSDDFSSFGASSDPTPVILKHKEVLALVRALPQVDSVTSQVSGFAFLNLDAQGQAFNLLFGVEPDSYFQTFHSIRILEGRMLKNGESGIMMSRKRLNQIAEQNKAVIKLGDEILLQAFSSKGIKIRSVPLVGIYEYVVPTQALEVVSFVDVQTMRALNAMTVGSKDEVKVDEATQKALDASSDDFFSDAAPVTAKATAQVDLNNILGDKTVRNSLQTIDTGSWHNILVRLKAGSDIAGTMAALNKTFDAQNLGVKAVGWKEAAGTTAALTDVAKIIFNIVIIILAIVAVIIIINTLVISVMERTSEIGTMRALGAQKAFIRRLFITETMLLAGFFGVVGIVLGSIGVTAINIAGIKIDNDFLQILFGAATLKPNLSLDQMALALVYTAFIGLVSWVYPVSIALKVSPLKAITTE